MLVSNAKIKGMQPLIVLTEGGNEVWFPSWEELARFYRDIYPERKCSSEGFRSIHRKRNYGRRNRYGIQHIWLSNFDKEKIED